MIKTDVEKTFTNTEHLCDYIVKQAETNTDVIMSVDRDTALSAMEYLLSEYVVEKDTIIIDGNDTYILALDSEFYLSILPVKNGKSDYYIYTADEVLVYDECEYSFVKMLAEDDVDYTIFTIDNNDTDFDFDTYINCDCADCDGSCKNCEDYYDDIYLPTGETGTNIHIENMYGNIVYGDYNVDYGCEE